MRRELSDAFLRTLRPPATGRIEVRDARVRGLILRLTAAGATAWSVRTLTRDGKHTRVMLGTYPALGLAEARRAALDALATLHRGGDPVAEKRAKRAARKRSAAEPTVAERWRQWQDAKAAGWSDPYAAEVARLAEREVFPRLGNRKLAETTRAEWTALIGAKRKTAPAVAAHLYRVASSFLNHAEAAGWIPLPLLPRKGAVTLAPQPDPRARVLTDAELAELWAATEGESPKVRAFVRLLILTAARREEVAGIRAGEVDREAGLWRLPPERTKNGQAITLPLGPLALAELGAVWPAEPPAPDWRLLGRFAGEGFSGFSRVKGRIDAAIAAARAARGAEPLPPWRVHDLRRTARTGMTRLGVPKDHAEAALNHVSGRSALERTYDRHDYAPEILAAGRTWQAFVAGLVGDAAPVVSLAERRRAAVL
jgi:integrase